MNIEIQKYYTDNESRVAFISSEIENMKSHISVNKIYETYEEIFKEEILKYMLKRDIVHMSSIFYSKYDLQCLTLIELFQNIIEGECQFSGEWEDAKSEFRNMKKTLISKKNIECLSNFEKIINFSYRILSILLINNEDEHRDKFSIEVDGRARELLDELRKCRKDIIEKNIQYLPQIASLKKEKQLLIKINKQLKIEYKGEIII